MIISAKGPQNAGQILKQFTLGHLFLSPEEYQRENAWDLAQKQLLIDSMFRGYDIPKFYLWKIDQITLANGYPEGDSKTYYLKLLEKKRKDNDDPNPYIYEAVDGQQRIRTILEFMGEVPPNDKCYRGVWYKPFPALLETPMAKGRLYSQLKPEQQSEFDEQNLTIMVLEQATIEEIRDMFFRLQNGTPLNAQQKRNAMGSNLGRAAKELADLSFFAVSVNFDNTFAIHNLVASQMLLLEQKGAIASCTSRQLDKLYKQYQKVPIDPAILSRAKSIVLTLGKIFSTRNQHLNQNYALSLYWLLSRMLLSYNIPETEYDKIRATFVDLDIRRIEALDRGYSEPGDELFEDLTLAMSRGNTGTEGISTRHDVIGRVLFQDVSLVERPSLDPNRAFTFEEKLLLYHRANGCCQIEHNDAICGRPIDFDNAVVDHITPHCKGGKTVVSNGRIAFKSCNIARGAGEDFDPKTQCCLLKDPVEGLEEK